LRGTNKDIGESGTDGLEKTDISAPDKKQTQQVVKNLPNC